MNDLKYITDGTAGVVMHPARYLILQCIRKSKDPLYVDQLAKAVDIHPRMVSHHLDVLEEQGLVECKYELVNIEGSKRGVAVRLCSVTPKTEEVFRNGGNE